MTALPRSVIIETARLAYDDIRETFPELNLPSYVIIEISNTTARKGATHFLLNRFTGDERFQKFTLSKYFNSRVDVDNTMRHEVAHMVAGHAAGHGLQWKRMAQKFGITADRCTVGGLSVPTKKGHVVYCANDECDMVRPYQRTCKTLEHIRQGNRAGYSCTLCGSDQLRVR